MTARDGSRSDGLGIALAIHLTIYAGVFGLFATGFYLLMQPSQRVNPGLAAYAPPPATVIAFAPPQQAPVVALHIEQADADEPAAALSTDGRGANVPAAEPSTEGRGAHEPAMKPVDAQVAKPKRQKAKSRSVRQRSRPHDFASYPTYRGFQPF